MPIKVYTGSNVDLTCCISNGHRSTTSVIWNCAVVGQVNQVQSTVSFMSGRGFALVYIKIVWQ